MTKLIFCPPYAEITDFTLPDTVTEIGFLAFARQQNLRSIVIPVSVRKIGSVAFYYAGQLASVTVKNPFCDIAESSFRAYSFQDGCKFTGYDDSTVQTVATNNEFLFESLGEAPPLTGRETETVSWVFHRGTLTVEGTGALTNPGQTPGWDYFRYALKNAVIGSGITEITDAAFASCGSLETVSLPDSLAVIGTDAFRGDALREIVLPAGVKQIKPGAFCRNSALTDVTVFSMDAEYLPDAAAEHPYYYLNSSEKKAEFAGTVHAYAHSASAVLAAEEGYALKLLPADLNGDGEISLADAVLLMRLVSEDMDSAAKLPAANLLTAADLSGNFCLDFADVSAMLRLLNEPSNSPRQPEK